MIQFPHGARSQPLSPTERLQHSIDRRLQSDECRKKLQEVKRVAVVGGGLAGLMAARQLVRHDIAVSLYEARPFVGGRVFSNRSFSNGRIIEEGAELIGSFHTRWLELAKEFGLAMINRMESKQYEQEGLDVQLILEKRPLSRKEFNELSTEMDNRVLKPLAAVAQRIRHPSKPWLQATLMDFHKQVWPLRILDGFSVEQALPLFCQIAARRKNPSDELLWKMLDFKLVNDEVAPLTEMNFLGLLCKIRVGQGERMSPGLPVYAEAYWNELEIFRCADGCDTLATALAAKIQTKEYGLQPAKVCRLVAVTHIQMSKSGVSLRLKATLPDGRFKDDKDLLLPGFSHVILAIPPSAWPRVKITVEGKKVDPAAVTEIGPLHMNGAVKYFSKLKERFWIKSKLAPYGGARRLGQVWEGTDNQTRVGAQGVVLSVFAGPVSANNSVPTPRDFDKGLRDLFPGTLGMPGTPANPGYEKYLIKSPLFADWPNRAFIKTGYWSPLPGEIFKVSQKLTQPFYERLFFAGEHTDTGYFGYMEGALRSGERAANTLMQQACGLKAEPEVIAVAEAEEPRWEPETAFESRYLVASDEAALEEAVVTNGHEAVPVWDEAEEHELAEYNEYKEGETYDEDTPLPGTEANTESAAEHDDEDVVAPAFAFE